MAVHWSPRISVSLLDEYGTDYGVKHIANKIRVSAMPYLFDIAEGNVANHDPVRQYGHNGVVAAAWEVVSDISAAQPYLSSAERLKVVSAEAADDGAPAGDGARTVTLEGLDASYNILTETITMNGDTAVICTNSFLRVFKAYVATAGASATNEGVISIKNNAANVTLLQIDALEGQSHAAIWTAPGGYTGYIVSWYATESSNKGVEVHLFIRPDGGAWRSVRSIVLLDSVYSEPLPLPFSVAAKTDVEIRAKAIQAGANVTAGFEGWQET